MNKIKFIIITLFPELIKNYLQDALLAKATQMNLISVELINLRDFSDNAYKSVDDSPFGGGDGMLIRADILEKALLSVKDNSKKQHIIYFSPQGELLDQNFIQNFVSHEAGRESLSDLNMILICGRYGGIDQRFIDTYVDQEISIGNYVLSGGELPALVLIESMARFIPGVLGKLESAHEDSFKDNLLEAPQYTRPQVWNGQKVPEVLVSGNHQNILKWKKEMALQITLKKRPDLLKNET